MLLQILLRNRPRATDVCVKMGYLLKGVSLVYGRGELRKYVWLPLVLSSLAFFGAMVGTYWLAAGYIKAHLESVPAVAQSVAAAAAVVIFWYFAATAIFIWIMSMLSSWMWDGLSRKVESIRNPHPPLSGPPPLVADWIHRTLFALVIGSLTVVCGCFFLIPTVILAGWLGLYQYTASAFLRRGFSFADQFSRVFRCRGWFGYALACGLLTLIPIVNLLMLAPLVAAGTLMCIQSDDRLGTA